MAIDIDASSQGNPALKGLRVLEIGSVIMAPYAGKLFRDLGANVIKAEPPVGDIGRHIGDIGPSGTSLLHMNLNAGKRSIVADASSASGRQLLKSLIMWSEIILTNVLPRRRMDFGLEWESVEKINSSTILVTAQGYATSSSLGNVPAYDDVVQAASGIADTYRLRDGAPGYSPYVVADKVCGMAMVQAGLAALHQRTKTGVGTWVDVPMVDVMSAFNFVEHLGGKTTKPPVGAAGWSRVLEASHRPHRAVDGWICVLPYTDSNWTAFCDLADRSDLAVHPRLSSSRLRSSNPKLYESAIADYVKDRTCEEIQTDCRAIGVPVQPVISVSDLTEDEYLLSRNLLRVSEHEKEGSYVHVASPLEFHGSERVQPADSPALGADRVSVLTELSMWE